MSTIWLSPTGYVTGDPTLRIAYPFESNPDTVVSCTAPGDLKWISMGVPLPPDVEIEEVIVCYSVSNPLSYISQLRLVERTTPNQVVVRHDDPSDLKSTKPTCRTSKVAGVRPAGAINLALRLHFNKTSDRITLGAVGIAVQPVAGHCLDTVAGLKALGPGAVPCVTVLGCHAPGDGGGGEFYWDANSTASDDGGTIFAPAGVLTGRWKRLFSFGLSLQWFGARADGVGISELTIAGGFDSATWVGGIFGAADVGKRIVIHTPSNPSAGTVSTDTGSDEIVGNGTAFTTDVFEGQPVVVNGIQYEAVTIKDDTHLLINESVPSKAAGLTLYLAPRFSTTIKAVDSATQHITLAVPVPGTDPQHVAPAAYGTDNSSAIDAAETVAAIKGQEICWQPGLYLFAETLNRRSGTTWTNSPGITAPDGSQKGAQLMWAGQVGATGIRYFGTQFTETRGIALFGNLLLKFGVLVDSNNQPASSQNRFNRIAITECWDNMCIGTSDGVTEYQSDGILVQDSMFVNWTRAAIEINSQNAFQNSKIERGVMRQIRPRSACSFIRLTFSPNNFIVEGVTAGTGGSFSGAFIDVRYPVNSGGNYFLVAGCETELFGDIVRTYQDDNSGGGVILMNNAWGGDTMNIGHRFQVVSIGNRGFAGWSATGGPLCNVRSVGDIVSDPLTQGWHVANGATLWMAPLS